MNIYSYSFLGLLAIVALVNGQASKKKEATVLNDKIQSLVDSSAKRPVLRLNGNKFREYVRNAPRNYSMIVMFTALSGNILASSLKFKQFDLRRKL